MAEIDLITMQEAKTHLRVDFDDDDPNIDLKRKAASAAVLLYIENPPVEWTNPATTPFNVKAAALLILEALFDASEQAKMLQDLSSSNLDNAVVGLLYPYRMLSMA